MPFISSKVNIAMTKEQKETIRKKLGENISIIPGITAICISGAMKNCRRRL